MFTACLLFLAIAFHTLNTQHHHPAFLGGESITAVSHGEDKKWIVILASFFVWVFATDFLKELFSYTFAPQADSVMSDDGRESILKLFNYILTRLRVGLLNPIPH